MNWIKARLNRDNFWNIMFWLGMTIGIAVSQFFSEDSLVAGTVFWVTILSVPLILKSAQGVNFDKRYGFFNCHGKLLNDSLPKRFGLVLLSSIILSVITALIQLTTTLVIALFFLIPTLYFIYKNCPVSILFNRYAWQEGTGTGFYTKGYTPLPRISSDVYYSPFYSDVPGNFYYRKKHF